MTKLPTSDRPLTMDPDLADAIEGMLDPYEGEQLELAQMAVSEAVDSGFTGTWDDLLTFIEGEIDEAVEGES